MVCGAAVEAAEEDAVGVAVSRALLGGRGSSSGGGGAARCDNELSLSAPVLTRIISAPDRNGDDKLVKACQRDAAPRCEDVDAVVVVVVLVVPELLLLEVVVVLVAVAVLGALGTRPPLGGRGSITASPVGRPRPLPSRRMLAEITWYPGVYFGLATAPIPLLLLLLFMLP